jgi:hypothetical protein
MSAAESACVRLGGGGVARERHHRGGRLLVNASARHQVARRRRGAVLVRPLEDVALLRLERGGGLGLGHFDAERGHAL